MSKQLQLSSGVHLPEENAVTESLDLRAEKEALKEEREDWEKLRRTLTEKFTEDVSDNSSEISVCEVRSQSRISSTKLPRNNFEKLQIKIERYINEQPS